MMRLPLAWTKRRSVRLGALGTVLASAAFAGVQAFWPPAEDPQPLESPPAEVASPEPQAGFQPIEDLAAGDSAQPAPAPPSDSSPPDPPDSDGLWNDQGVRPALALSMPSPRETVVRGNDDQEVDPTPKEEPLTPPEPAMSSDSIYGGGSATAVLPAFRMPDDSGPDQAAAAEGADAPAAPPDDSLYTIELEAEAPDLPALRPQTGTMAAGDSIPARATPPNEPSNSVPPEAPEPGRIVADPSVPREPAEDAAGLSVEEPRPFQMPPAAASATQQPDFVQREDLGSVQPVSTPLASAGSPQGSDRPGMEQLDGVQTPSLSIEKTAPEEVHVDRQAIFQTRIRNVGAVTAQDVVVMDQVPHGTQLVDTVPKCEVQPGGQLMWELGALKPGDEVELAVTLMPTAEGPIGSVAQVLFATPASVRTVCTRPRLAVRHTGPEKVLIGETVTFDITVSNPGTGAATSVVLEENVPEGLAHPAGRALQRDVGDLRPGESTNLQLSLTAEKPGVVEHELLVRGHGGLLVRDKVTLEVIAPQLQVDLTGPKLRYLEREATYELSIANPGTAMARDVEVVTYLPPGMKFVHASQKGQYESQNHAVYWSLAELPAEEVGVARLTVLPVKVGSQTFRAEARAELGLQHSDAHDVSVESLAELQFTVEDAADPIEVGSETTYEITLTNSGASEATGIQLAVGLEPGMQPLSGEGHTRVTVEDGQLSIEPLPRLGSGQSASYRIRVQGLRAGPQRVQVQLVTNETPVPVVKEEVTRVYADR